MRSALTDPNLLGTVLAGESWKAWRTLLIAALGERLTTQERELFAKLTGREREPCERVEELWVVAGRRGGKTRAAAVLATYLATMVDHSDSLSLGERGLVLFLAQNTRQAQVAFGYAAAIFESVPMLAGLIANRTADTLSLTNGIDLEIRAASFRGLRGVTCVAVIADEACFWYSDETSANADTEILNAVRPSLATTAGPLIVISSPYSRTGEVYSTYRAHYGANGDPRILVAQGASRDFNATLPQSVVDRALERDVAATQAEYLGQFRDDVAGFVSPEAVEACVARGVLERAPVAGERYVGFCDPSGGVNDSMTLAVAHTENGVAVLDAVREVRAPFSPEQTVAEFVVTLRSYRVGAIRGDRYAGEWPREQFRKHGIDYLAADRPKSDIYLAALPLIMSRKIDLLDYARLLSQLAGLERRTARGGRDTVDHRPGARDDVSNAVAGALVLAAGRGAKESIVPAMWCAKDRPWSEDGMAPKMVSPFIGAPPVPAGGDYFFSPFSLVGPNDPHGNSGEWEP
jgi:hypothetical protein